MSSININNTLTSLANNTERIHFENRKTGTAELDQDAFLRMLMVQLKHQDPMNPMNNQEFMAQQAQFTQISELQKLNATISNSNQMMQASSLIGKEVTLTNPDNPDQTIQGNVMEARIGNNGAGIVLNNGKEYPLNSVISIKEASEEV